MLVPSYQNKSQLLGKYPLEVLVSKNSRSTMRLIHLLIIPLWGRLISFMGDYFPYGGVFLKNIFCKKRG